MPFLQTEIRGKKTVDSFSEVKRFEVEMARLAGLLLKLVDQTMHPNRSRLWLKQNL